MSIQELLKDPSKVDKICSDFFSSVDKNKNGVLEFREIKRILSKFAEDTDTAQHDDEEIRKAFNQLDTNKDGKINLDEFKNLFKIYLNKYSNQ